MNDEEMIRQMLHVDGCIPTYLYWMCYIYKRLAWVSVVIIISSKVLLA